MNNEFDGSRAGKLAKRKKTNLVLNSLITIVLLLIIFVSVNIFFDDGQEEAKNESSSSQEVEETDISNNESAAGTNDEDNVEKEVIENEVDDEATEADADPITDEVEPEESESLVTDGGSSPDVEKTMINPDWKPVGTSQTGEHIAVYDQNSVDWQEMLTAVSYATGIDVNQMTVWFLGNNGGSNQAAATVSENGGPLKYRVAIEWVDNQGWKPVKVEELQQEKEEQQAISVD